MVTTLIQPPITTPSQAQSTVTSTQLPPSTIYVGPPSTISVAPPPTISVAPSSLMQTTDPRHITPATVERYQKLLSEAEQYEKRFKTVSLERGKQLASRIRSIMNKVQKETLKASANELFDFLKVREQKNVATNIYVTSDEGKLFIFVYKEIYIYIITVKSI